MYVCGSDEYTILFDRVKPYSGSVLFKLVKQEFLNVDSPVTCSPTGKTIHTLLHTYMIHTYMHTWYIHTWYIQT